MGSLRLYAIGIDEVRAIFGAPEATATALRAIAAHRFPAAPSSAPGLLGKLGPVFRRAPDAPVLRPGVPHGPDEAPALVKALQDFVKAAIAPYKYPREVRFRTSLPRNASGKFLRRELRDGAAAAVKLEPPANA